MGFIKINNINLSPPTPYESRTVIVSHKETALPDILSNWEIDIEDLLVPAGGVLPTPYIIDGLDDNKQYTVKVTSDCGNYFFTANYTTGYACPAFVSGSLQGLAMQSIPYEKCSDCAPVLNGVVANQISALTVGALTSATCTITGYVIDWYLDNETVKKFTSGSSSGIHTDVTAVHPFAGEPAEGGTWHPRIRFLDMGGVRYSAAVVQGTLWSPDLNDCLPTIAVQSFTCANGGSFLATVNYSGQTFAHKVTYTNNLASSSLATRSLKFVLDATNRYFSWYFAAYEVYDSVKITHVSPVNGTSVEKDFFRVGSGSNAMNQTLSPKQVSQVYFMKVIDLTSITFAAGDYLRIDITPHPTLTNTNWEFLCKCLSSITCTIIESAVRGIQAGSVAMVWNATDCAYDVTYNRSVAWTDTPSTIRSLHLMQTYGASYATYYPTSVQVKLQMRKKTEAYSSSSNYSSLCAALTSSMTFSKTGSNLFMGFNSDTDYQFFKTSYNEALTWMNTNGYTTDDTLAGHYMYFSIGLKVANSCGDTITNYGYQWKYSAVVVFDDTNKTISVTLATIVNNYIPSPATCSAGVTANIQANVNAINNSVSAANVATQTTFVRGNPKPINGYRIYGVLVEDLASNFKAFFAIPSADICDLASKGWTSQRMPYEQWEFPIINDRVVITNNADPINNFRLQRKMGIDGIEIPLEANWIKVYEIINGVES